jgi:hypothetical protein
MPTNDEYESAIRAMRWPGLMKLWEQIKAGDVAWWEPGKAFEYLVVRIFELNKAVVNYPYSVSLFDTAEVEQIDGSVQIGSLYGLIESKDEKGNIAVGPIAKMRNQLLRRPAGTIGLLFSSHAFTPPAILLAHFALPQAILLWSGDEVETAIKQKRICDFVLEKYRYCVEKGMLDYSIREF